MTKQTFLHGTLILVGAGFVTKVLGFVYRIALSRIIGDEGMGLFQMAFPILVFAIGITTAGLPVAISKLISEAEAKGREAGVRSILDRLYIDCYLYQHLVYWTNDLSRTYYRTNPTY